MQKLRVKTKIRISNILRKLTIFVQTRLTYHIVKYQEGKKAFHLGMSFWLEKIFFSIGVMHFTLMTSNLKEAAEKINKLIILKEISIEDPTYRNAINDYMKSVRVLELYKDRLAKLKNANLDQYKETLLKM